MSVVTYYTKQLHFLPVNTRRSIPINISDTWQVVLPLGGGKKFTRNNARAITQYLSPI